MGYRTNQCQHCGQYGHNRRGCPQIKEAHARVERLAKKYGVYRSEEELAYPSTSWICRINEAAKIQDADEDEISWRDRWLWEEIEDRKMSQARKNSRGRQCGFCGERGHNARTCPSKKEHRVQADRVQGLAHRVVAAILEKAGIVPGAVVGVREWNWKEESYSMAPALVSYIEWDKVAQPGYQTPQGIPNIFEDWFSKPMIRVQSPSGESAIRIPYSLKQCPEYHWYEGREDHNSSLISPYHAGEVNKNKGWKGDDISLIDPEHCSKVQRWSSVSWCADEELTPVIEKLIAEVGLAMNDIL